MKLSLIIPCYNEEGNVFPLYEAVNKAFAGRVEDYEFVFVNDGSFDDTYTRLNDLYKTADVSVKVLHFSRNFGKEAAIHAGLSNASGDCFTIMDGDLQQSPSVVADMVDYLNTHPEVDCVTAYQETRKESPVMVFFKDHFYKIINRVADTEFVNGASDFRTFRTNVKDAVLSLPEGNRFSKGIFSWVGFETYYMPYTVEERFSGTSKWSFVKLWKYALSGIISFTTVPLRLPLFFGVATLSAGGLTLALDRQKKNRALPAVLFGGGLQLLAIGVLGEYLARIYQETKHRPRYIIKEFLQNDTPFSD